MTTLYFHQQAGRQIIPGGCCMDWKDYPPRGVNRGGTPDPSEVVGRDTMVTQMWRALDKQSVLLTAERRLGKTSVLLLMENQPASSTLVFRRDLEDVRTPLDFVERIVQDISANLSLRARGKTWLATLRAAVGGAEIGGILKLPEANAPHWKLMLERVIGDLITNQEDRVVFLWDELPLMLDNICKQAGEPTAMELLDTLRALRQRHSQLLRMVYTGSVGLHHVLGALRRANYVNAPTNDMLPRNLPALETEPAMGLAWGLLQGEQLSTDEPEAVVRKLTELVDCVPFYIQHVVGRLADEGGIVTPARVEQTVAALLHEPHDPWEMRNYRRRIDRYYLPDHQPLALGMLDALAVSHEPLTHSELSNRLLHQQTTADEDATRDVLDLLQQDHYILSEPEHGFQFRFGIVRRAWRAQRGI
jgi:hypothetical protein